MGSDISKPIGPRSNHNDLLDNEEIDYRDPINAQKAKNELYALFIDDKIVHISRLDEAENKIAEMEKKIKALEGEVEKYKKINSVQSASENSISRFIPNHLKAKDLDLEQLKIRIDKMAKNIKNTQYERKNE